MVKSLIVSILKKDPKQRPTIAQIKKHPWLSSVKRKVIPKFVDQELTNALKAKKEAMLNNKHH